MDTRKFVAQDEDEGVNGGSLNSKRRAVLKVIGLVGASAWAGTTLGLLRTATATASDETRRSPSGVWIGTVQGTQTNLVLRLTDHEISVVAAPNARMYSGAYGEVTAPNQFVKGDRVVVQGTQESRAIVATYIGSIFRPIDAKVTAISVDGAEAETTLGVLNLNAGRLPYSENVLQPALRNADVAPGMNIRGLYWQDPRTSERYLLVRDVVH